MSNCIDENYGYMALTKSIDELVAVDEKLEINTLRLDTLKTLNLLSFCDKYGKKTEQNANQLKPKEFRRNDDNATLTTSKIRVID